MDRIRINDWQEMALKKDTEIIIKKIEKQEPIFASVCWEIVLAVGILIIERLFDTNKAPIWFWVVCATAAIVPPVFLLLRWFIIWQIRIKKARKGALEIKQFVDSFDNQICYWVMMSNSYTKMLQNNPSEHKMESIFVFQESSYYINKSIDALYKMKPVVNKVFSQNQKIVISNRIIAFYRLVSILDLMQHNRKQLDIAVKGLCEEHAIKEQKAINVEYDKMICRFIKDINNLFSIKYNWGEKQTLENQ